MAITDNWVYVKRTIAGSLGLLMFPSAASAESKFLYLVLPSKPPLVSTYGYFSGV